MAETQEIFAYEQVDHRAPPVAWSQAIVSTRLGDAWNIWPQMPVFVANALGDSIDSPSAAQLRTFLFALDARDEEHGAAWLVSDDDVQRSLEWSVDGRLVLSVDTEPVRHLLDVSRERVLQLWNALASGQISEVEREAWQPGNGIVVTEEMRQRVLDWQQQADRAFYDVLGEERSDVRCREDGCERGAISLSVLCRPHHFEMVQRRPCPFRD